MLKDILDEWKREVDKKAPSMSADDAYAILGLTKGALFFVLFWGGCMRWSSKVFAKPTTGASWR